MPSSGGRTIRRATSADLALLADLHLRLVEDQTARGWRGSPMTPAMERDYIARRLHRADVHYLIAEAAGQPIGYIEAGLLLPPRPLLLRLWRRLFPDATPRATHGYIHNIFVTPEARGSGIGRLLLDEAIACLKRQGIRRLRAHVIPGNAASFALFAAAGLQPTRTEVEGEV